MSLRSRLLVNLKDLLLEQFEGLRIILFEGWLAPGLTLTLILHAYSYHKPSPHILLSQILDLLKIPPPTLSRAKPKSKMKKASKSPSSTSPVLSHSVASSGPSQYPQIILILMHEEAAFLHWQFEVRFW